MNKAMIASLVIAASLSAATVQAQIAGHNVILVHGYQSENLTSKPDMDQVSVNGEAYWDLTQFWLNHSEARLDWGSDGRVEGKIATQMYEQAVEMSQTGLCANGCVLVTHSTGDLTARYFLAHQEDWLAAAGLQPLNITAVLDFAGAGGGTEGADLIVDAANGDASFLESILVDLLVPNGIPDPENLGVLIDLKPVNARNLGNEPKQIPHLRYVGFKEALIVSEYLLGSDDGVVPAHSTCASVRAEAIDSCSNSVAIDGERTSVNGPAALRAYHYPVLMGEEADHRDVVAPFNGFKFTYVMNSFNAGINMNLDTVTVDESPWWNFWGAKEIHQYVKNSEAFTMSEIVVNSLN